MKRLLKSLSILLVACIILPLFCNYEIVNASQNKVDKITVQPKEKGNKKEKIEFPDIVDEEEIRSRKYVGRHKEEEKDLHTFVFENEDGSKTMRVYSHPVKYIDEQGKIKDISLKIKKGSYGKHETSEHEIKTTFEKRLQDGISLEYEDVDVKMIPIISQIATYASDESVPEATMAEDERTVSYKVDDTTSFEYELTYAGFKEDIVVNEYTGQTEYEFILQTNGLKLCEEYGSYYLADNKGDVKATIGDIIIFTADEANNTMGTMTYEVIKPNYEYELTIHIDAEYLKDEKTVYPIRIDPTVEINYTTKGAGAIEDVTINSATTYSGTSGSLYVGKHSNGSSSRILMRFPKLEMPVPFAPMILSAQVEVRDLMCQDNQPMTIYCYEYNGSGPTWSEAGTTTWNGTGGGYRSALQDSLLVSYGKGNVESHRYGFDITELAKRWADGVASPKKGIVLSANAIEGGSNAWYKTFASYNRSAYKPSLSIRYETRSVCLIRNEVNGAKYLKAGATIANSLSFNKKSEKIEYNGQYLWSIEYLPTINSFNIVSMGLRYSNGTGAYAILNSGSSVSLVQQITGNPYIRFSMVRYSSDAYYVKSATANRYLASNGSNLSVATSKNSNSIMYIERIDTASFNNFFSGTYSKGIYNGVAHIKIIRDASLDNCALYKDNDLSSALLWNGITDNVIIYGPNDTVPSGITPLYVTFKAEDTALYCGYTVPNGYTYDSYMALSSTQKNQILCSNWNSVTIYLNNEKTKKPISSDEVTETWIKLLINKVITHEMGHALKLTHPEQINGLHEFEGARGGYDADSLKVLYSIMHQGDPRAAVDQYHNNPLTSAIPQALDMINLISKWEHHQNCSH